MCVSIAEYLYVCEYSEIFQSLCVKDVIWLNIGVRMCVWLNLGVSNMKREYACTQRYLASGLVPQASGC